MKILHLCVNGIYTDHYSYQENMLVKYHRRMGLDVEVFATAQVYDSTGRCVPYTGDRIYTDADGAVIRRFDYKRPEKLYRILRRFVGFKDALQQSQPDILFIHGCQFKDIDAAAKWLKKHPKTRVFVDNHADFNNSATNFLSKNILHKGIWKRCAHIIEPFTAQFYGVTPSRVDFLREVYGLPAEKCSLLVMGADDDAVENARRPGIREQRRKEYGAADDDIVIVTGGKIDHNKPQVLKLMQAVGRLDDDRIRLIVFGSVADDLKAEFDACIGERVKYIGWRKSEQIYEDFAAAELAAFPGLHSVLWEEAVGMGIPCLFKRIGGFEHVDLGGNCLFFENDDPDEYMRVIQNAAKRLDEMKAAAQQGRRAFSYRAIAERALEG